MIRIKFDITDDSCSMDVQGHAEYNPGNDIVCSAVSALSYTLVNSLIFFKDKMDLKYKLTYDEKSGNMQCYVDGFNKMEKSLVGTVFHTIIIGMEDIANQYPDNVKMICR